MGGKRTPKKKLGTPGPSTNQQQKSVRNQSPSKNKRSSDRNTPTENISPSNVSRASVSKRKSNKPIHKTAHTEMFVYGKRFHVSFKILKEMKALQSSTETVIPKISFARVVREILQDYGPDIRVQYRTLEALQHATEMYMHQFFEDSNMCTIHAKRATLTVKDMQLVQSLRKNLGV